MADPETNEARNERPALFATTHWSVVVQARNSRAPEAAFAMERLCQTYWYPLYAFVRRKGHTHEDACDLTQEFFRFLEKLYLRSVAASLGKFRRADGSKLSEASIAEGRLAGRFQRWHENGQLAEVAWFSNGMAHGVCEAYFPSGSLKARVRMERGSVLEETFRTDADLASSSASVNHSSSP